MADGFGGIATAFNAGVANGVDAYNARTRRQQLQQDQTDSLVTRTEQSINSMIDLTDKTAQSVQGDDPNWGTSAQQMKAQIDDTINALKAHATAAGDKNALRAADAIAAKVNVVWPSVVKTPAQRNMDALKSNQAKEKQVQQFVDQQFAQAPQPADATDIGSATMPSPVAPGVQGAPGAPVAPVTPVTPQPQMAQAQPMPTAPQPAAQPTPDVMSAAQAAPDQGQPQAPAPQAAPAPEVSPNQVSPDQLNEWKIDAQKQRAYDDAHDAMLGAPSKDELDNRKQARTDFYKLKPDAIAAASGFAELNKAKELLPKIISGKFADTRLAVGKAIGTESTEAIKATETFQALMRDQVLKRIKALGSNSAVSDTDRIFVSSMSGENIELNPNSIAEILDHAQNMYKDILNNYNQAAPYYGQKQLTPSGYIADNQSQGGQSGPQQVSLPQADKEGWVDLGGGVRIRAVH